MSGFSDGRAGGVGVAGEKIGVALCVVRAVGAADGAVDTRAAQQALKSAQGARSRANSS